ncbi:MAG: U32 family peptidase [Desulfobacterales bacterium]|nr:U32 family peptidase [Desulfobacterales bacterium]
MHHKKPEILAPAGSRQSFLAAVAAGADAIFCGLKSFSARMEAKNFSIEDLSGLTKLAHSKNIKVYVTFNTLIKPDEVDRVTQEFSDLAKYVKPDAIIIQDLAFVKIARDINYKGELHLSTLFNQTFGKGLSEANLYGIDRVVVPRELSIDEIKSLASDCKDVDLEVFIHGALCYGVSGRCYWSSFLGGKSGLRGRCVQPCRRNYEQKGQRKRFFSCQDLSVDVLVKVMKEVPQIATWKIEGRKKGPHYVYYTTTAYKILRDEGSDPQKKKEALGLLDQALGRVGTHYNFLSQRPQNPVNTKGFTASGRVIGKIKGGAKPFIIPREGLLKDDLLRIGYEDEKGHSIYKVTLNVPKKGKLHLKKVKGVRNETTVFLIDRREKQLNDLIEGLEDELKGIKAVKYKKADVKTTPDIEKNIQIKHPKFDIHASKRHGKIVKNSPSAVWLTFESLKSVPGKMIGNYWFILPPVIWPDNEEAFTKLIQTALKWGAKNFILNGPFQTVYFKNFKKKLNLWAGPFCNISNDISIDVLKEMGFNGVFVSPELNSKNYFSLAKKSTLPLGIILTGHFPLTIARTVSEDIRLKQIITSPMGEQFWVEKRGADYWIFPNWKIDLSSKRDVLVKNGYKIFLHLNENIPKGIHLKERAGLWNWDLVLK